MLTGVDKTNDVEGSTENDATGTMEANVSGPHKKRRRYYRPIVVFCPLVMELPPPLPGRVRLLNTSLVKTSGVT
jgi:hypothetical protein